MSITKRVWGAITAGAMTVVSYIFWGVAPRTLGRQHAQRVACAFAGPLSSSATRTSMLRVCSRTNVASYSGIAARTPMAACSST